MESPQEPQRTHTELERNSEIVVHGRLVPRSHIVDFLKYLCRHCPKLNLWDIVSSTTFYKKCILQPDSSSSNWARIRQRKNRQRTTRTETISLDSLLNCVHVCVLQALVSYIYLFTIYVYP